MMYLNLFKRWLGDFWGGLFPRGFRRSPFLPFSVVALVIVFPIAAWKLHRLGRFGQIKREIKGETQGQAVVGSRPGGADPIILIRNQTAGSNNPEFRSATLLPGLGMGVLQITAFLPSRGEVELLAAPSLMDVADGTNPPRSGSNDDWGALEMPWSGLLTGVLTPVGTTLRTSWNGKTIEVPSVIPGRGISDGGLLRTMGADTTEVTPKLSPTSVTATFKAVDFDQYWLSKNAVSVSATLGATAIDLDIRVTNVGDQPEPMGLGWHPRFVIPSGNREGAEIRLPNGQVLEIVDTVKGTPSGKFASAGATIARFQQRPWPIGAESVDSGLVHLKPSLMEPLVSAEVRDPTSEFGLRMTAVSDTMRELRVASPTGSNYVSLGMQTNMDDPLGKEWIGNDSEAIGSLLPGQTAEWKVRLEIFSISNHSTGSR